MAYIIFLCGICLFTLIFNRFCKNQKLYLILCFIFMALFIGLKTKTSAVDLSNYEILFNRIRDSYYSNYFDANYEIGFMVYMKVFIILGCNYFWFLFINAFITLAGFYRFIKKYSSNYFLSIFIFITSGAYLMNFGLIRQALAISILLFSFDYLKDKKYFKYSLIILIAFLIHKSAICMIPFILLSQLKPNRVYLKIIAVLALFTVSFKIPVLNLLNFLTGYKYNITNLGNNNYLMIIALGCLIAVVYFYKDGLLKKFKDNKIFINMLTLSIVLELFANVLVPMARAKHYYTPSLWILIPNIINSINNKKERVFILTMIFMVLTLFYIYRICTSDGYIPWHFIIGG